MSLRRSGLNPLAYLGVEPVSPPLLITENRAPTSNDYQNFNLGSIWIDESTNDVWMLVNKDSNVATWALIYPQGGGGSSILYETDSGSAQESGGILKVLGDSGPINTSGSGNTLTVGLSNGTNGQVLIGGGSGATWANITAGSNIAITNGVNSITIAASSGGTTDFVTDFGTATESAGILHVVSDGGPVSTMGSSNTVTISHSNGTNGQLLIGGGTHPQWRNITSTGGTIEITNGANSINIEALGSGGGSDIVCAFSARQSATATNVTGSVNIPTTYSLGAKTPLVKFFDVGNDLSVGDGAGTPARFTAPTTGKYFLYFQATLQSPNTSGQWPEIAIVTPSRTYTNYPTSYLTSTGSSTWQCNVSAVADMTAGDTATFTVYSQTGTSNNCSVYDGGATDPRTYIGGFLISNAPVNTLITTFTASGTWIKNSNTKMVGVTMWGGGSGGGSGRRGASTAAGGGGGGVGSEASYVLYPASFFGTTETVTVGAGGSGGAAITVDNTNGNNGSSGGVTSLGLIEAGDISSDGGGQGGTTTTAAGGNPEAFYNINALGSSTADGGAGSNGNGQTVSTLVIPMTALSGGGGGGADSVTVRSGGRGGSAASKVSNTLIIAGGAGGIETGTINGGNGINSSTITSGGVVFGGSGGGGGGGQSTGLVAGNGGNGGIPGGGGGGGGGSLNGTNSGAGGTGGRGEVWIVEYM